jgi:hypothetical protein
MASHCYYLVTKVIVTDASTSLDLVLLLPGRTETKLLEASVEVNAEESWRPRRDLNPCYRRESAKEPISKD